MSHSQDMVILHRKLLNYWRVTRLNHENLGPSGKAITKTVDLFELDLTITKGLTIIKGNLRNKGHT